ncbi:MAG: GNAT family N-acetyltransferase [Pyrinomonadaceae bacterium]|nr:GNAT family N-acetyltransferase [Pyrinomonadaceae bacterium]
MATSMSNDPLVSPDSHGQGHGRALMSFAEEPLAARGARLIIVETSSVGGFERARAFYPKCGYTEEARIRNFYALGDDKIVFSKSLTV